MQTITMLVDLVCMMDRNKMPCIVVGFACFTITLLAICAVFIYKAKHQWHIAINDGVMRAKKLDIKSKELDIGIHDWLTYCLRTVMMLSKENGKLASSEDAERVCAKFVKSDD